MERRRDYRHTLSYPISIKAGSRVLDGIESRDVSASGLGFRCPYPHGLSYGDRIELQLTARVEGSAAQDSLVMATQAVVVRTADGSGAVRFERPLSY